MCRWGYGNLATVKSVSDGMRQNNIPQDAQWTDIDYMDHYLDFTTDPVNYPLSSFQDYISSLHQNNQHFMNIHDPGISFNLNPTGESDYFARSKGLEMNVFVESSNGKPLVGKVWPGFWTFHC